MWGEKRETYNPSQVEKNNKVNSGHFCYIVKEKYCLSWGCLGTEFLPKVLATR
jgi:hypothetical protein